MKEVLRLDSLSWTRWCWWTNGSRSKSWVPCTILEGYAEPTYCQWLLEFQQANARRC